MSYCIAVFDFVCQVDKHQKYEQNVSFSSDLQVVKRCSALLFEIPLASLLVFAELLPRFLVFARTLFLIAVFYALVAIDLGTTYHYDSSCNTQSLFDMMEVFSSAN